MQYVCLDAYISNYSTCLAVALAGMVCFLAGHFTLGRGAGINLAIGIKTSFCIGAGLLNVGLGMILQLYDSS